MTNWLLNKINTANLIDTNNNYDHNVISIRKDIIAVATFPIHPIPHVPLNHTTTLPPYLLQRGEPMLMNFIIIVILLEP